MKRKFFLLLALLFLPFYVSSKTVFSEARPIVHIGVILPLTGPMSSFGEELAHALPLFEKKFNNEQSRYIFKFLLEDGRLGMGSAAISAAKKLVSFNGVQFLVVGSSGEALQIAPFCESKKALTVASFAIHPDIKNSGDFIFRTYVDAEKGIRTVVQDMKRRGFERVAIISEESSFALAIKKSLHALLGENIVFSEDFALGSVNFKTLIAKAKTKKPQAYYINASTPANYIQLVQQMRAQGITEVFYTYYTPSLPDVQKSLGEKLKGTIFLDFPPVTSQSKEFSHFLAEYEKLNKGEVRYLFNFQTNYNAFQVIFDGIMAVGPDSTKVKDYLYTYKRPSATGQLEFDKNGDVKNLELVLRVFGEGGVP